VLGSTVPGLHTGYRPVQDFRVPAQRSTNTVSNAQDDKLAKLEQELAEAKATIADQRERLKTLGTGREESMLALGSVRDELRRVSHERDKLLDQLARLDDMQTSTIALPEERETPPSPASESATLPTIDDLMADLSSIRESGTGVDGHLHMKVEAELGSESEDMLSPALVFPERYAKSADDSMAARATPRVLVLLDGDQPIKWPIYRSEMTIGRIDIADIKIDSHFISRLHARLVTTDAGIRIEDIDSKNGIKVNGKLTKNHELKHGDLITLGSLRFRFLDLTAGDTD
jgi:uncharacterized coiled-coil protein SlyX